MSFGAIAGGIGAGLGIISSIAGGIKARKEARKQRRILKEQLRENDQWFNSEYYRDVLDNPESRSYLKTLSGKLYKKDKATENNAVATGATHENVLAQKQAANEVMSDAVNNIVAQQTARKDDIRRQYIDNKRSIQNGMMAMNGQNATNWVNMAGNIASSAGALANTMSGADFSWLKGGTKALPTAGIKDLNDLTNRNLGYADSIKDNSVKSIMSSWRK